MRTLRERDPAGSPRPGLPHNRQPAARLAAQQAARGPACRTTGSPRPGLPHNGRRVRTRMMRV